VECWSGRLQFLKVSTTPRDPQRAVIAALAGLLERYEERPAIALLAHATTIATNALLGQIGLELPRTALVTTHGFRDVIEIGRQNRSALYDLNVQRPRPLVARRDRFTVNERLDADGNVLQPLDDNEVERVCSQLRDGNYAAVAICLLHAYANDAHERRIEAAVLSALPNARVTRSSHVDPAYREYERFSTTVVNAVLAPIVVSYLERLLFGLCELGIDASLYVMRSDGGLTTAGDVLDRPAALIESGPASGATAAAALGRAMHLPRVLAFDMGGTTAKAGTILDGRVQVAHEFEAAGTTHSGRGVKGSGYAVRFPFADLAEISAGGGTIAFVDEGGSLRVGPLSAGADPGPACYGRCERATVTDANVVLGRLHQAALLGGTFPIDAARSRAAVASLARELGMGVEACAAGIVALVDHAMAQVLRIVTVERGLDPREFTLIAFGGGGPLHACAVAQELEIARVIVPVHPGCFAAQGLLNAALHADAVRSVLLDARAANDATLAQWFAEREDSARNDLGRRGALADSIVCSREYDARYRGQGFELTVAADGSPDDVVARFHDAHRARYGYEVRAEVVELVNARLRASGRLSLAMTATKNEAPARDVAAQRRALWRNDTWVEAPVVARSALAPGEAIHGPAIIEEYDCTTYVPPGWRLTAGRVALELERCS
jgi:N-methylhydantoinase A